MWYRIIGITIFFYTFSSILNAQSLSVYNLDTCLLKAEKNYPKIVQYDLIEKSGSYTLENANKGKLPQVSIKGQASYQSDVTALEIGIPGAPQLSKDQYKLYGEVIQPISGIAVINQQKKILESYNEIEKKELESQLYKVKVQVSNLYFGILFLQNQISQSEILKQDIDAGIKKIEASIEFGIALKSTLKVLQAEALNIDQRLIELRSTQKEYMVMLSQFINEEIETDSKFLIPSVPEMNPTIKRPELNVFDAKNKNLILQSQMIKKDNLPKLNFFIQGGLGRPALNFLNNDFQAYYIGGLRLNWNLSNYYTSTNRKQLFVLQQKMIEAERETFIFQTELSLKENSVEIQKINELIEKDQEIVKLRESIVETAKSQLENGLITATEYKNIVNDADRSRQNLALHQIELLKLKNNYKLTSGN